MLDQLQKKNLSAKKIRPLLIFFWTAEKTLSEKYLKTICGIGDSIHIGREIKCLPSAGFFPQFWNTKTFPWGGGGGGGVA